MFSDQQGILGAIIYLTFPKTPPRVVAREGELHITPGPRLGQNKDKDALESEDNQKAVRCRCL